MAEARQRRGELAKKYHPDVGGSKETMAEINKQYDDFVPQETDWEQSSGYSQSKPKFGFTNGSRERSIYPNIFVELDMARQKIAILENEISTLNIEIGQLKFNNSNLLNALSDLKKSNRDLDERNKNLNQYNKNLEFRKGKMLERVQALESQIGCMGDPYHISLWQYIKRRYFYNKRKNKNGRTTTTT
jgi:chromosome segregation ATPase